MTQKLYAVKGLAIGALLAISASHQAFAASIIDDIARCNIYAEAQLRSLEKNMGWSSASTTMDDRVARREILQNLVYTCVIERGKTQ